MRWYSKFGDILVTLCVPPIYGGRCVISRRRDSTSMLVAITIEATYLLDGVDDKDDT